MKIRLNGEMRRVEDGLRLGELVASLSLNGNRYAVEVNEVLIPRSEHADYILKEGDRVEVVQAIGGG